MMENQTTRRVDPEERVRSEGQVKEEQVERDVRPLGGRTSIEGEVRFQGFAGGGERRRERGLPGVSSGRFRDCELSKVYRHVTASVGATAFLRMRAGGRCPPLFRAVSARLLLTLRIPCVREPQAAADGKVEERGGRDGQDQGFGGHDSCHSNQCRLRIIQLFSLAHPRFTTDWTSILKRVSRHSFWLDRCGRSTEELSPPRFSRVQPHGTRPG